MGKELNFKTTDEIKVPKRIIDQVIGQEKAVNVIKKAANQRRHVLLIGEPGTGKSMLGLALAELLPKEKLVDIISLPNPNDENQPYIRTMPAGKGREFVAKAKIQSMAMFNNQNVIMFVMLIIAAVVPYYFWKTKAFSPNEVANAIIYAASMVTLLVFIFAVIFMMNFGKKIEKKAQVPKVIVDNYNKKTAPFFDATGAHAGALLGDVLHDPFQSLGSSNEIKLLNDNCILSSDNFPQALDKYWSKPYIHKEFNDEKNYEAVFLPKNELQVIGETQGSISPVEVLSSNKYEYEGQMIKLTTSQNKKLIVTPEHKIAVIQDGKKVYIEANKLKKGYIVLSLNEDVIIDEEDIIKTYDAKQQEQCKLYYQYHEIKKQNPFWSYKKIAKAMGQRIGKTRRWHTKKNKPVPVQTVEWLKEKGLLPFTYNNPSLSLIAKVLGATFGDAGICENLNSIFLSSKEKGDIEEFGTDLESIFGLEKGEDARIIEGGEFGHSWCYQNTNRNIIRFFIALKSPVGKKPGLALVLPTWIYKNSSLQKEFFSSFFGSRVSMSKVHVSKTRPFSLAVAGIKELKENRIKLLEKIKDYLASVNVKTGKISAKTVKTNKGFILFQFLISTDFQDMINFSKNCTLNYSRLKRIKLAKALIEFKRSEYARYKRLISQGHGAETAMKKMRLTPKALYEILNDTEFIVKEPTRVYA